MFKYKITCQSPSGRRVVPCGQTDGHADMTKLLVAYRNFSDALKFIRNTILPTVSRKNLTTDKSAE